jgi:hypothetical protein
LSHHRDWYEFTNISEVLTASINRAMAHHPDNGHQPAWHYKPKDSYLHIHCHENNNSYDIFMSFDSLRKCMTVLFTHMRVISGVS